MLRRPAPPRGLPARLMLGARFSDDPWILMHS
jgi:hypothetical protein